MRSPALVWQDCDKPDMGSCGNACCIMDFKLATNTSYTYSHFKVSAANQLLI